MGTSCVLDIVLIPLHLLPNEITSSQYFTGDDSDDDANGNDMTIIQRKTNEVAEG